MKLHLGCDKRFIPGFVHIDLADYPHIDHRHDVRSLPMIADASADLIFASMAFHHFSSPQQTAKECWRVLRKGGAVCIRNSTRERSSPYEAYFPNYRSTLDKLPPAQDIIDAFTLNGFTLRRHEAVPHLMAKNVSDLAEKAAFRADTTLLRLSDRDFEQGLANMRAARDEPAMIDIDLFIFARD